MKTSSPFFHSLLHLLPAVLSFFLFSACSEGETLSGNVASVNWQGLSFQMVESRRALLFAGASPKASSPDDAELQKQYRYVIGKMIEEAIICQYMEAKGNGLEEGIAEKEENRIRADYPDGFFEEVLAEQGLSLDLWREGVYRRLLIDQFVLQVLRPEIVITAEEVQLYYRQHSEEFVVPEQWHFLQIRGPAKKDVELARDSLIAGKDPAAAQKEFLVTIHDIRMGVDLLPEDLLTHLAPLKNHEASKTQKGEGEFRVLVLMDKTPASMMDAAEISRRVEQALSEEKMRAIYAAWIQKRLVKENIRIAPAFAGLMEKEEPADFGVAVSPPVAKAFAE
jgi:hypothetical protein